MKRLAGLFRANDSLILGKTPPDGLSQRQTLVSRLSPDINNTATNKKDGKRRLFSLIWPSQSELVRDTELDAGHGIIRRTIAVIDRTDILVTAVDIHDIGVKLGAFGQIVTIPQRILVGMAVVR